MRRDEHERHKRKVARIQCMRERLLPSNSVPVRSLKVRLQPFALQLSLSRFLSGMMCLSHHDTIAGGTTHGWCTVYRAAVPPDGGPGFHEPDPGRVSAAGPAL